MNRRLLVAVLFAGLCTKGVGQSGVILNDPVSSRYFTTEKYTNVKGSPFLNDGWTQGYVRVEKGIYRNLKLKLDAYANVLYFEKGDEAFEFQEKVLEFTLTPSADSASFQHFIKGLNGPSLHPNQFVQVLASGNVSFYKSINKMVSDVNMINQGIVKSFASTTRYYLQNGSQLSVIKLGDKESLDFLGSKKAEVEVFIKGQKLSIKKEADFSKIVSYYNSLP